MSEIADRPALEGELISADAGLTIITITNPFDPREHTRHQQPWMPGMLVVDLVPTVMAHAEYVISVNGGIIDPENYTKTFLKPDDHIVMCPVPEGGGGGKNILRIVAMIAVTVIANYFAPGVGSYLSSTFNMSLAAGTAIAQAGIMIAGSMLVNSLLPVKPVQPNMNNGMGDQTNTYGIDGPKNSSAEGIAVPVCYGSHRMAGNIIGLYVENVEATQMLYMLINAGEGPILNIDQIELNDQPIGNFQNAEWKTRMGTANQELIDWFNDSFTARNVQMKIPNDGTFWSYTTPGTCEKLRFDVVFPGGLFKVNKDDGSLQSYSVEIAIDYKQMGSGTWIPLQAISDITSSNTTTNNQNVTDPDPNGGSPVTYAIAQATQNVTYQNKLVITDKSRSAVRRSFSTPKLAANARYDIRIKRITPKSTDLYVSDEVYLSDINEITPSKVAYNHSALVGIKVKLTDQLNGLPNVTFVNHGRVIKMWDPVTRQWGYGNNSNPAWIALDMLTHMRYGGQLAESRIDMEAFKDWAKHCDDNNLEFNGVFDSALQLWDALQYVCRLGHAQLVNVGTRWSVAIERADTPVMMFGMGNIAKGSFKINWLPMTERANEIAVTFFNATNKYRQETLKVYDPAVLNSGRPQRSSAITLFGCTDENIAAKEGGLLLNMNRYILQTCEFETNIEALACTVGSLIYIQHDMPNWEWSGRLAAGSTSSVLQLDRPITFPAGSYKALVIYPSVQVGSATVTSVNTTEKYVGFSSLPAGNFKRVSINGVERAAQRSASTNYIWVDDVSGISNGQVATFYDTDVIVEADVVNPVATVSSVTLTAPLAPGAPAEYSHWMIGPVTKVKRKFRVKNITAGSDDLKRHVTCVQYDEAVYNVSGYTGPGGIVPPGGPTNPGYALSHVQNLSVYEEVYISGAQVKNRITLAWSPPQYGIYKGADVYVSVNNDPMKKVTEAVGAPRYSMDADVGSVVKFKVVAFDMFDKRANFDTAPTLTYTVTGTSTTPPQTPPVTGLNIIWSGRDCKLYWRYNSRNNSYEIGSEPYGADSGSLDPSILDYEVKVYHNVNVGSPNAQTWVYKRTEYTTRPAFTYTYEMNQADGLKRHLKFEVRVRPKIGAPGPIAFATAYNPPPWLYGLKVKNVSFETAEVIYNRPTDPDFDGVLLYVSQNSNIPETPETLAYDGPNTSIILNKLGADTVYWVKAAAYDTFGKTGLNFTQPISFKTTFMDINAIADGIVGVDKLDALLRSRIDLVDGDMPNSVNARILGEANARQAAVLSEQTARQNADSSQAAKTDTVYAALAGVGSAAAQEAIMANLTSQGGTASILDSLSVSVANAQAAISTEQSVRAAADTSQATSITTLTSKVDLKNRTFFQNAAPVSDSNYTLVVNDVWIETDNNNKRYMWNGATWLATAENALLSGNRVFHQSSAPASDASYTLRVSDLWFDTLDGNRAYRWNGTAWVASADDRITSHTTSIQTMQTTIDGIEGQYTVKIDNNGYVTGFGLASTGVQDPATGLFRFSSEFEVLADKFSIRFPSYPTAKPFTVGMVNGLARIVVDGALIGDATITNAKIGNEIKSDNFEAGVAGWRIQKNGTAEFDKLVLRGWKSTTVYVPNNGTATHNWGESRTTAPVVTVVSSAGSAAINSLSSTGITVRLDFSSGGNVDIYWF
jgi:predicted phage tail protein